MLHFVYHDIFRGSIMPRYGLPVSSERQPDGAARSREKTPFFISMATGWYTKPAGNIYLTIRAIRLLHTHFLQRRLNDGQ